jgi:hypothetical protein
MQEATLSFHHSISKTVLQFTKPFIEHLISNQGDYTELYCDWFCCALEWKPNVLNLRIELLMIMSIDPCVKNMTQVNCKFLLMKSSKNT